MRNVAIRATLRLLKLILNLSIFALFEYRFRRWRASRAFYQALRSSGVPRAFARKLKMEYGKSYPRLRGLLRQMRYSSFGRFAR